jgi:serine protease Do
MSALPRILAVFPFCLFLAGCQSASTNDPAAPPNNATPRAEVSASASQSEANPEMPEPINMDPLGSKPVTFQRVVLKMETGETIGKVTGGWLNIVQTTLKASPGEGSKRFNAIGLEELRKAHYTIPGGDNPLFEENESAKARYQLGAQITSMRLDVHFQPGWASVTVRTAGEMTAEWQVYDTLARKVVFTQQTHTDFHQSVKGGTGEEAVFAMFRKGLRGLLADQQFSQFMRPGVGGSTSADLSSADSAVTISSTTYANGLTLPTDLPVLLESFVMLEPGNSIGSAFIISSDGYVLTAAHVVSGLKTVPVRLHNGVVLEAAVLRVEEGVDVALLKLPGTSYKPLTLSSDAMPAIGSDVFAIGNPAMKELNGSVSKGVVGGNREIDGRKFIQTDAAANPGNSGGPLLDRNGRVIGLISWKFAAPEFQGLAFAVPIQEAMSRLRINVAVR